MIELARVEAAVAAPIEAVWAVVADFGNPQRLASSIERCELAGDGVGAVRTVHARGLTILERLTEADGTRHVLRYEVLPQGDMPAKAIKRYEATATLRATGPAATCVSWSSQGEVEGDLGPIREGLIALYAGAIENLRKATGATG